MYTLLQTNMRVETHDQTVSLRAMNERLSPVYRVPTNAYCPALLVSYNLLGNLLARTLHIIAR